MRGVLSEGMLMCASTPEKVEVIDPPASCGKCYDQDVLERSELSFSVSNHFQFLVIWCIVKDTFGTPILNSIQRKRSGKRWRLI